EALEVEPDAQGRILVPQYLKEHAGLRFDVLVQGAGTRAEIWDTRRWSDYERKMVAPAYKKIGKSLEI
ncbi:MAG: division/cell wall cluster transcriptional repressor MraZ, partial [Elusimicrobia bacterium]|nr:division/cell wall cluster transcriptional repressor MraZ [Elusimicrobiota bacterium]